MAESRPFPARLRALMDAAGVSVSQLARDIGTTRATVYNLLNGTHPIRDWALVQRIADRFGVTTDSLRESGSAAG